MAVRMHIAPTPSLRQSHETSIGAAVGVLLMALPLLPQSSTPSCQLGLIWSSTRPHLINLNHQLMNAIGIQ